ncbi:MAG TPA: SagB/ThcOx family dehydrogenase [Candidatus Saccharimonadales bacterium]|nr:SagB/ThcOx family dehydrogenase [Candidatus Saccharimonadales bacterium]
MSQSPGSGKPAGAAGAGDASGKAVALPPPRRGGTVPVEATLLLRASVREYRDTPVALADLSQLLWAGYGITHEGGKRAAPSAGAKYPLDLYVVAGMVEGLAAGIYRYRPEPHDLVGVAAGDLRRELAGATWGQEWLAQAPLALAIAATYARTTAKYGDRGRMYVHLDAGMAAENIALQAVALSLGTVAVGAFDDAGVARALRLPPGSEPVLILPVGRPR